MKFDFLPNMVQLLGSPFPGEWKVSSASKVVEVAKVVKVVVEVEGAETVVVVKVEGGKEVRTCVIGGGN